MTCKTIVVHLDSGARCAVRTDLALGLAKRYASRLVGIAPTGMPDVMVTMNGAVPDAMELVALSVAALRENAERAAREFERRCAAAGMAAFEAHIEIAEPADAVVRWGRASDLIVVGQTDTATPIEGVAFDFPQQVLLHSGAPVLVVPYAGTFTSIGSNALIGWKDTREAARALRDALPLLGEAKRVTLLAIAEQAALDEADPTLAAAAAWIESHGLTVRSQRDVDLANVGDQLLSRAAELGADLIVIGGYGHSRLREWVLGGATRHLLERMTVPTLLSH
jgi:nucleotide-binding universal stress UspA family protein